MNNTITSNRNILAAILILALFAQGYSQDLDSVSGQEKEQYNYYTQLSFSSTFQIYRDFSTSPLFYRGRGTNISTAWLKRSEYKERVFETGFGFSPMFAQIPESDFIQPESMAFFANFNLRYQRLWKLPSLSNDTYNFKFGGTFYMTQNIRVNPNLQNNAFGMENLSNLMVSGQVSRDVSRKKSKQLNFWIYKPTLKPKKRDLRFQLNAGVLNFNYRPGYAYSYDAEIVGTETDPLTWILSNYTWSLNGWRLNTDIEYITYLPNGNARSWSYGWETAHAPGKHEAFQMVMHQIRFIYYFHTKKQ